MLSINTETMLIGMTRGDTASIVFSAKGKQGHWFPDSEGQKLRFVVTKKRGGATTFEVVNTFDGTIVYDAVTIDADTFNADKTLYFTEAGGTYTQCTEADEFDSGETYYVRDCGDFWTIIIGDPSHDDWYQKTWNDDGTYELVMDGENPVYIKFGDYRYDVEVITSTGKDTIIGLTDDIDPIFRVWGENV